MPTINPRQEIYAQQRALGFSQASAYRTAYGNNVKGAGAAATRLEARPEIRQRIAEL